LSCEPDLQQVRAALRKWPCRDRRLPDRGRRPRQSDDATAGADVEFYFKVRFHRDIEAPILGITFTNREGVVVYAVNNAWMKQALAAARAGDVRVYRYRVRLSLAAGDWFVRARNGRDNDGHLRLSDGLATFHLTDRAHYGGLARLEIEFGEVSIGVAAPDDSSSVSP